MLFIMGMNLSQVVEDAYDDSLRRYREGNVTRLRAATGTDMHRECRFNNPELLDELQRGNCEVWEEFYREMWDSLCKFIYTRSPQRLSAQWSVEDLVQETFTRAYAAITGFRRESRIETWMFGIALHIINDATRAAERENRSNKDPLEINTILDLLRPRTTQSPEKDILNKDLWTKLVQKVEEELGPASAQILKARYEKRRSEQQIADAVGLRRGTASYYLSQIRTLLYTYAAQWDQWP